MKINRKWRQLKMGEMPLNMAFLIFYFAPYIASYFIFSVLAAIAKVTFGLSHSTATLFLVFLLVLLLIYELYVMTLLWKQSAASLSATGKVLFRAALTLIIILIVNNVYNQIMIHTGLQILEARM